MTVQLEIDVDGSADRLLQRGITRGHLKTVVILGISDDGDHYVSTNTGDAELIQSLYDSLNTALTTKGAAE